MENIRSIFDPSFINGMIVTENRMTVNMFKNLLLQANQRILKTDFGHLFLVYTTHNTLEHVEIMKLLFQNVGAVKCSSMCDKLNEAFDKENLQNRLPPAASAVYKQSV